MKNYNQVMRFERDEVKHRINRSKHGIRFETAILVFEDPKPFSVADRYGTVKDDGKHLA